MRKSMFLFFLLGFFQQLYTGVNPIDGENLWRLTSRIGDVLCSQLETIEECLVGIMQSDIPLVINEPGSYRVCENLVHTAAGAAIEINSDNVTLDFGGNSLSTTAVGSRGVLVDGQNRVTIRNGTISAYDEAVVVTNQSFAVIVEDIVGYFSGGIAFRIESSPSVIIDRCAAINSDGFISGITNAAFWISGTSADYNVDITLRDCIVTASDFSSGYSVGYYIDTTEADDTNARVEITRCSAHHVENEGFLIQGSQSRGLILRECTATHCGTVGFSVAGGGTDSHVVLDGCIADECAEEGFYLQLGSSSSVVKDCCSSKNIAGFRIATTESNIVLRNCTANENSERGIWIQGDTVLCENCTASGNNNDGFDVTSNSVNIGLIECVANSNGQIGFDINGDDVVCQSCTSHANGTFGFNVASGAVDVTLSKCVASSNGSVGFEILQADTVLKDSLATHNNSSGIDDNGVAAVIFDTRSSGNGAADVTGSSSVVTY